MKPFAKVPRFIPMLALCMVAAALAPVNVASALEPPRVIPHSAHIDKPMEDVFKTLRSYFSDTLESKFHLVTADEKTGALVAKQNGIDSARWKDWAACSTDPMHMIYNLNDAAVTVTINLKQDVRNTTFMTVSADFQGTYGLMQDQTTLECRSTGALEDNLLALAGAQTAGSQNSPPTAR